MSSISKNESRRTSSAEVESSAEEFARAATRALESSPYPALVLEIPAERIVAASPAAALLLDPAGAQVIGQPLSHFTADRPPIGPDRFAGGRLNGFEAIRMLRRAEGENIRVRVWIRSFADQPSSRYVLAIVVEDQIGLRFLQPVDRSDLPAVVGIVDTELVIERISSDADTLFGWPESHLLGRPLIEFVAEHDVSSCTEAVAEAARSAKGVTLYLDMRNRDRSNGDAGEVGCELLILPLHPSPSYAFVLLPTPVALSRAHASDEVSTVLARLGRAAEIADLVRGSTAALTEQDLPGLSNLTTRELEVLTRLLDGDRAPAIAADLFLTQGTVRNHLVSIFSKVGVSSQQQLLTLFREARAHQR